MFFFPSSSPDQSIFCEGCITSNAELQVENFKIASLEAKVNELSTINKVLRRLLQTTSANGDVAESFGKRCSFCEELLTTTKELDEHKCKTCANIIQQPNETIIKTELESIDETVSDGISILSESLEEGDFNEDVIEKVELAEPSTSAVMFEHQVSEPVQHINKCNKSKSKSYSSVFEILLK